MARKHRNKRKKSAAFRKRTPGSPVGAPPGQLTPSADAAKLSMRVFSYGPDDYEETAITSVADLVALRGKRPVTWLNIDGLADVELIQALGDALGLHALALEDVVSVHQRPKVEDYADNAYIVLRMPSLEGDQLDLEQISVFVSEDLVVTFQERPGDCFAALRDRIRAGKGRIRGRGVDFLAYALIDAIVDQFFPVIEHYGDRLEDIETEILAEATPETLTEIHTLRHDLLSLRRTLWPLREALSQLARGHLAVFSSDTRVFLRDCYDHAIQLLDLVEACREMMASLIELHMSGLSQRMNEIMKVLTLIATIFIPLGFLAGLWGMNFDRASPWNMPELGWRYGYPVALALMLTTGLGFVWYFRRKGWIGGRRRAPRNSAASRDAPG